MIVTLACECFVAPSLCFATENVFAKTIQPMLKKHCIKCHGEQDEIEGDVDLVALNGNKLADDLELVSSLIDVLDLQEMPPEDEPELPSELRKKVVAELKTILHTSVGKKQHSFVRAPIRRMNRFQYNNAVQDLFDLKCNVLTLPERMLREHGNYFQPASGKMSDLVKVGNRPLGKSQLIEKRLLGVAAFPQDLRAEHGFDNRGDHLSLSPLLMESFLKLSQSVTNSRDFTPRNVGIWNSFFARPNGDVDIKEVARERLAVFLRRAFRRPPTEKLLNRYAGYVSNQLDQQVDFTAAMKSVAAATIASPNFLYLHDRFLENKSPDKGDMQKQSTIDDFELGARLSFFLWGSIPDDELLDLAAKNLLHKPEVLNAQIDRLLSDRKLKRFCDSFPSQWLQLDRLVSSIPDREKYPSFFFSKYLNSMHMMIEPLLLFETVLIEDLSITQLIDSDFTYRSALLEKAYGSLGNTEVAVKGGNVGVLNFNRIDVTDRRVGGVITNAAVMTMTSGPTRTQPITRGAWLAGVIFNNPPEPPPADVPELDEKPPEDEEQLTLRERLAMHRERSDCKGCHEQIDPLGFALENFDPIGVWREKYDNDREIDMSGTLFREHEFGDVIEFKNAILKEKDRFTRGFAGHLLSFSLARELGPADQMALDKIAAATASDDYKMKTIIKQVILSEPFRVKTDAGSGADKVKQND